jgi:hypothetical protein
LDIAHPALSGTNFVFNRNMVLFNLQKKAFQFKRPAVEDKTGEAL